MPVVVGVAAAAKREVDSEDGAPDGRGFRMTQPTIDPTFYRSAAEAAAAPIEQLAYVVAFDRSAQKNDAMTVVDVNAASESYGRVVGWTDVPGLGNELYGAWDDQFYPDGVGAWMAKLDTDPDGGLSIDESFFPHGEEFRGLRVHQIRLQGGDASSDSYCYS
jgi:hypothetical protein